MTTHAFQTEVTRLLHLMVHSLYKDREVFLRELILNASDACDKLRFQALTEPKLIAGDDQLGVTVRADKDAKTLTVEDNGIGLTEAEAIDHLGTIARSGTKAFLEQLQANTRISRQAGRASHRPVRCRLLCRVHGCRPRGGRKPQRALRRG